METDFSLSNKKFSVSKQKIFFKSRFIILVQQIQMCLKCLTFLHVNPEELDRGFCMQKREDISIISPVQPLFTPVLLTPPLSFSHRPVAGGQTGQSPLLRSVKLDLSSTKFEAILQQLMSFLVLLSPARKAEFRG